MIKEKLKSAWAWTKDKARRFKKWITVIFLGGIVLASTQTTLLQNTELNYPLLVDKQIEQIEYAYRAKELLRLEHNEVGKTYRDGIITREEWQNYLKNEFDPRSKIIEFEVSRLAKGLKFSVPSTTTPDTIVEISISSNHKDSFKNSTKWDIDIKNILK